MSQRTPRIWTALAALVLAVVLAGCDWAQLEFGPNAGSFNPYEPSLTPASASHLAEQWSAPCACDGTRPLVVGDTVYAIDGNPGTSPVKATLRAFSVVDGATSWATPLGATLNREGLAAVANGLVYVVVRPASGSDQLVAIDATSGAVRWRRTPPVPGTGPVRIDRPVVDGAQIFVTARASDASTLSAYDPTGRRVWTVAPGGQVIAGANPAVVTGQTVYVSTFISVSNDSGFVLLRGYAVADGATRSTVTIPDQLPVGALAVANGLVYGTFATDFGRASNIGTFAIDPVTGSIKWTGELLTLAVTPGAVLSDNPRSGELVAHDPITGAPKWTSTQTDFTATATDQLVFFSEGTIRRLSDGAVVGRVQTDGGEALRLATPANGRVFASSASRLYALAP